MSKILLKRLTHTGKRMPSASKANLVYARLLDISEAQRLNLRLLPCDSLGGTDMKCTKCGRHRRIKQFVDSFTPFGAQGPENLDPLDEEFVCKSCWPAFKKEWIKKFKQGFMSGDWRKSDAEVQTAKKHSLVWINSGSDWPGHNAPMNCYVTKKQWLLHKLTIEK